MIIFKVLPLKFAIYSIAWFVEKVIVCLGVFCFIEFSVM
jgi:hypothetical protein